jgi:uncharacterized Zn finger protein
MSGRGWYQRTPKQPPPKRGIKLQKAGTTWWGKRWIDALERVLGGEAGRLSRGRTYARAERTHDLVVKGGRVTAKVTGSRPKPYDISIEMGPLTKSDWDRAIAAMASRAEFEAELLADRMPPSIDEAFAATGNSLFPLTRADLVTNCSCPDWGDPCKHVAAAHYVLGEALDRDPFLLFELRGRTKGRVLEALHAARSGVVPLARKSSSPPPQARSAIATVKLTAMTDETYDAPPVPLPSLRFTFDIPPLSASVLRALGKPAGWPDSEPPAEALAGFISRASEWARRRAVDSADIDEMERRSIRSPVT